MTDVVQYLEDIPWFQDLPESSVQLNQAQRLAVRKNHVLMTRNGIPAWAFLIRGQVQWQRFDPDRGKVIPLAQVPPGQFVAPHGWDTGAVAVSHTDGEMLLLPQVQDQACPMSRTKDVGARARTPANDLPFHAYYLDLLGPFGAAVDVGSGTGHFAQLMAGYCDAVVAVDPSEPLLQLASQRMNALGYTSFASRLGTAEQLPLDDASADLIGCRLAVHQMLDAQAFAREAQRVLRVGGFLAITDIVGPEDPQALALLNAIERTRDPSHTGLLTKAQLLAPFEQAFQVVGSFDTMHRIAINPWLREAAIPEQVVDALHKRLAASSSGTLAVLGIAGAPSSDKTTFDSPRFSVILKRFQ